jgi:hypothetical protein
VSEERPVFTRFQISREKEEHKVSVTATLRNPGSSDLTELWVSVTYFDGDRELRQSRPSRLAKLPARGTAPLTLEARQVEKFSRYEVMILSDDRNLVYSGSVADGTPKLQRVDPPRPRALPAGPTVELRGLQWFDRDPLETHQEGPGDIPFLKFALRRKGQVHHPTGKLKIMVFDGKKPLRYLNIDLEDTCYARDAGDLTRKTALPETTAYEPISGEIWVGLIRMDHAKCALRMDITVILDGQGTWSLNGMEKGIVCEPREPDKK